MIKNTAEIVEEESPQVIQLKNIESYYKNTKILNAVYFILGVFFGVFIMWLITYKINNKKDQKEKLIGNLIEKWDIYEEKSSLLKVILDCESKGVLQLIKNFCKQNNEYLSYNIDLTIKHLKENPNSFIDLISCLSQEELTKILVNKTQK